MSGRGLIATMRRSPGRRGPAGEGTVAADGRAHVRIARPTRDIVAAERFWISGLGLRELFRKIADGTPDGHDLLMVGWPDAGWHLELVHDPTDPVEPRPTDEDLLVIYLGEAVPEDL